MLDTFIEWGKKTTSKLSENGEEVIFTLNDPSENSSARMDIDTSEYISRITFWDSGDVNLEIIDFYSEDLIYSISKNISIEKNIDNEMEEFFTKLNLIKYFK